MAIYVWQKWRGSGVSQSLTSAPNPHRTFYVKQQKSLQKVFWPTTISLKPINQNHTTQNSAVTPKETWAKRYATTCLLTSLKRKQISQTNMPRGQNPTINGATNVYPDGFIPVDARNVFYALFAHFYSTEKKLIFHLLNIHGYNSSTGQRSRP